MNLSNRHPRIASMAAAILLSLGLAPTWGQEMDHSMHQPEQATASAQLESEPADPHAGHQMPPAEATEQEPPVDHSMHAPAQPATKASDEPTDPHAGHDMPAPLAPRTDMEHAGMEHDMPAPAQQPEPIDHAAMGHGTATDPDLPATAPPREPIPTVTPADRTAAFPGVGGHAVHDTAVHSYWLLDRLEAWDADEEGTGVGWEALAWVGTDLDRIWLRSEGERVDGSIESGDIEVLYGRAIARWWDLVGGVRHDFGEGPSQTFAALGVMGLAPYMFEVEATAYLGESGQTGLGLEAEYETLFTNRLIGQWLAEAEAWGRDDPERGIGSGLSTLEAGFRLRYEFHRQFAPYIGVVWERAYGGTADYRRQQLHDIEDTRVVAGVRIWF